MTLPVLRQELDLPHIQGLVARGYSHLRAAAYALLRIEDVSAARRWLAGLLPDVATAAQKGTSSHRALQIAFTHDGFRALGLPQEALDSFAREFQEGMTTDHRQRILDDTGDAAPSNWLWGGDPQAPVHILLALFAQTRHDLDADLARHRAAFSESGLREVVAPLHATHLPDQKEHFGFHDGVGQPVVEGLSKSTTLPDEQVLAAGEIVLGYPNEYGKMPDSPMVSAANDPHRHLLASQESPGERDFGREGTYLVFRQLRQDVQGFWRFAAKRTQDESRNDPLAPVRLASKMVGRWPSGASLVLSPEADDPDVAHRDDFLYHAQDPHGDRCPVGSHVRRSNPRDALEPGPEESLIVADRHRILRRGRAYGPPVATSMRPEDILASENDGKDRGLLFICLNANISRQFEFVQQTWINNPKFGGLYNDPDPMVANHREGSSDFTVQQCPVRHRETNLQRFVLVQGGAYFFLPSIRALRYLAMER